MSGGGVLGIAKNVGKEAVKLLEKEVHELEEETSQTSVYSEKFLGDVLGKHDPYDESIEDHEAHSDDSHVPDAAKSDEWFPATKGIKAKQRGTVPRPGPDAARMPKPSLGAAEHSSEAITHQRRGAEGQREESSQGSVDSVSSISSVNAHTERDDGQSKGGHKKGTLEASHAHQDEGGEASSSSSLTQRQMGRSTSESPLSARTDERSSDSSADHIGVEVEPRTPHQRLSRQAAVGINQVPSRVDSDDRQKKGPSLRQRDEEGSEGEDTFLAKKQSKKSQDAATVKPTASEETLDGEQASAAEDEGSSADKLAGDDSLAVEQAGDSAVSQDSPQAAERETFRKKAVSLKADLDHVAKKGKVAKEKKEVLRGVRRTLEEPHKLFKDPQRLSAVRSGDPEKMRLSLKRHGRRVAAVDDLDPEDIKDNPEKLKAVRTNHRMAVRHMIDMGNQYGMDPFEGIDPSDVEEIIEHHAAKHPYKSKKASSAASRDIKRLSLVDSDRAPEMFEEGMRGSESDLGFDGASGVENKSERYSLMTSKDGDMDRDGDGDREDSQHQEGSDAPSDEAIADDDSSEGSSSADSSDEISLISSKDESDEEDTEGGEGGAQKGDSSAGVSADVDSEESASAVYPRLDEAEDLDPEDSKYQLKQKSKKNKRRYPKPYEDPHNPADLQLACDSLRAMAAGAEDADDTSSEAMPLHKKRAHAAKKMLKCLNRVRAFQQDPVACEGAFIDEAAEEGAQVAGLSPIEIEQHYYALKKVHTHYKKNKHSAYTASQVTETDPAGPYVDEARPKAKTRHAKHSQPHTYEGTSRDYSTGDDVTSVTDYGDLSTREIADIDMSLPPNQFPDTIVQQASDISAYSIEAAEGTDIQSGVSRGAIDETQSLDLSSAGLVGSLGGTTLASVATSDMIGAVRGVQQGAQIMSGVVGTVQGIQNTIVGAQGSIESLAQAVGNVQQIAQSVQGIVGEVSQVEGALSQVETLGSQAETAVASIKRMENAQGKFSSMINLCSNPLDSLTQGENILASVSQLAQHPDDIINTAESLISVGQQGISALASAQSPEAALGAIAGIAAQVSGMNPTDTDDSEAGTVTDAAASAGTQEADSQTSLSQVPLSSTDMTTEESYPAEFVDAEMYSE